MKIKTFQFNPLGVNTYVLSDENGKSVIIDPSCFYHDEKVLLLNYILDNNLKIIHLLNTHLHFDHIFGNNFIVSPSHEALLSNVSIDNVLAMSEAASD